MNKSNQSEQSRHNGRRLSAVVGILVSAALMAGPLMSFADDSSNQNPQAQDAQTSAQTGQQPADGQTKTNGQENSKGGVSAATPSLGGGSDASKTQAQQPQVQPQGGQSASGEDATKQQQSESTPAPQSDGPAPQLAKMLSYNKRVDDVIDEMRMDFVLRVGKGAVSPNCQVDGRNHGIEQWDAEGDCGLQLFYSDGSKDAKKNDRLTQLVYVNTLGTDSDNVRLKKQAAAYWARNKDQFFTIHSITNIGDYDYVSISAEGDADYMENQDGSQELGGKEYARELYAVVGRKIQGTAWCTGKIDQYCQVPANVIRNDKQHAVNVAANYPVYLYSTQCSGDKCAGPVSYVGYNIWGNLWSGGQANWGMHLDNGMTTQNLDRNGDWKNYLLDKDSDPGVAPAKSFFVYWNNPGYSDGKCGTTTSFYYEWFGRKDGKWLPATSINSHALISNGQVPSAPGGPAPLGHSASYNTPGDGNAERTIMGDGPAQNPDGSINFKKAKDDQQLDGYFKLVTWPVSTDQAGNPAACIATDKTGPNSLSMRDVYNPLYGGFESQGVSLDMAQNNQDQAQYLMDLGSTIDTAFDGFTYAETPDADKIVPKAPDWPDAKKPVDNNIPAPDSDDHTPVITKMLAYNNKVGSWGDELRADFVLRVGHGDVDPRCVRMAEKYPSDNNSMVNTGVAEDGDQGVDYTGECGLSLSYVYGDKNSTEKITRETRYINTLGSKIVGADTNQASYRSAFWWAKDVGKGKGGEKGGYTIRDIQSSGSFDYLTISLEGDVDYPNDQPYTVGGAPRDLGITAATGKNGKYKKDLTTGKYKVNVYGNAYKACGGSADSSHCPGPISSIPYDETHPTFWSGGEANWGLTVDHGFQIPQQGDQGAGATANPGVAPANSFMARVYNPDTNDNKNLCDKVAGYYFQWFALTNGTDWVPVQELTPTAQRMDQTGQEGTAPSNMNGARVNASNDYLAQSTVYGGLLAQEGLRTGVQGADGTINFGTLKAHHPEYNGYYKMVTWPISTNSSGDNSSCIAGNDTTKTALQDAYNPLYNKDDPSTPKGATIKTDPAVVQSIINKGWTINTVYDQYSYSSALRNDSKVTVDSVDVPHTVKTNDGDIASGSRNITIKGTDKNSSYAHSTLSVYAVYMGNETEQGNIDNPTQGVLDSEVQSGDAVLMGTKDVTPADDANWSMTVSGGKFEQFFDHKKDSQRYRFIAVDRAEIDGVNRQSPYGYLNQPMDMTPVQINAPKINYWKLEGKLSEDDAYNGFDKVTVRVTWGTGKDDHVEAKPDASTGVWKVTLPQEFALGHNVKIDATDPSNNESKTYICFVPKPVRNLPLTGSWLLWLLILLLILATAEVIYRRYKHNKEQASVVAQQRGGAAMGAVPSVGSRAVSKRAAAPRHTAHRSRQRRH